MSENKCCGNCKSFIPSIDGFGACSEPTSIYGVHCNNEACSLFKMKSNNGWTLITQDNEEEVYNIPHERLVFANYINGTPFYTSCDYMVLSISTMAKYGGYYYYVLPELMIE